MGVTLCTFGSKFSVNYESFHNLVICSSTFGVLLLTFFVFISFCLSLHFLFSVGRMYILHSKQYWRIVGYTPYIVNSMGD